MDSVGSKDKDKDDISKKTYLTEKGLLKWDFTSCNKNGGFLHSSFILMISHSTSVTRGGQICSKVSSKVLQTETCAYTKNDLGGGGLIWVCAINRDVRLAKMKFFKILPKIFPQKFEKELFFLIFI